MDGGSNPHTPRSIGPTGLLLLVLGTRGERQDACEQPETHVSNQGRRWQPTLPTSVIISGLILVAS